MMRDEEASFLSLSLSADRRYAGEGAVLDYHLTPVHGDSLRVLVAAALSLYATCNMLPLARPPTSAS